MSDPKPRRAATLEAVSVGRPFAVVLIAVLAFGYLSGWGLAQSVLAQGGEAAGASPPEPQWAAVITAVKDALTALGIVLGGIWTYFKFFRGRTFTRQLEMTVGGRVVTSGGAKYLVVTAKVVNRGLSEVEFDRRYSRVEVSRFVPSAYEFAYDETQEGVDAEAIERPFWLPPKRVDVFQSHEWIEPHETIADQLLLTLPKSETLALRLELLMTTPKPWIGGGITWSATGIVEVKPEKAA